MPQDARQKWFAHVVGVGLDQKILSPTQVTAFVTPEVLAHHLPPEVMSALLAASLAAGQMTPERMIETLTPEVLVDNVPLDVLWRCIDAGAERSGIASEKA